MSRESYHLWYRELEQKGTVLNAPAFQKPIILENL